MNEEDRMLVTEDEKQIVLDLTSYAIVPPESDVQEGEIIYYYAANPAWAKIIEGHVSWLASIAAWVGAENENYHAIQQVLTFLERVELPVEPFDCGDVEDCLETSTIINNLTTQINNLNEQIDDLENQLEETQHEQEAGNPLPPNPDMADSGNSVCRGANFIAQQLSDRLLTYWEQASTLSLEEFVNAILNIATIGFIPATSFWQFVFTLSSPELADDAVEHTDRIAQAFFCSNWQMTGAMDFINADPTMTENEKALWIVTIELYRQGQFDEWGLIGTLGTTEFDCTDGCPWVVVWDPVGLYEPDGSEDLIIPGNTWSITSGSFTGDGYSVVGHFMEISKTLPQQCKIDNIYVYIRKSESCAGAFFRHWWKNMGVEDWRGPFTIVNNPFQIFSASPDEQVLEIMKFRLQESFCPLPAGTNAGIGWIKMIGFGNMPTS